MLESPRLNLQEGDEGPHLLLHRLEPNEGVELGLQLRERKRRQRLAQALGDPVDGIGACALAQPIPDHLEAALDVVERVRAHSRDQVCPLATVNLVNDMSTLALPTTDPVAVANKLRPVLLKLNRHLRREIHSLGVTGGQVSLLVQIKHSPGIGIRELAARERISVPGMSKFAARLEEAGLVRRDAVGGDKRRVGLTLTEDGRRVLRSVRSKRTAWLSARLRDLDEHELEAVDRAIDPLLHLLGQDA